MKAGTVTPHALLVAQGLDECLAKRDAAILDRVVMIHLDVAVAPEVQVHRRVLREQRQHVVKERDTGGNLRLALAVDVEAEPDLCLRGVAFDLCLARLHGWVVRLAKRRHWSSAAR